MFSQFSQIKGETIFWPFKELRSIKCLGGVNRRKFLEIQRGRVKNYLRHSAK